MPSERPLAHTVAVVTGALGNLGPHWVSALARAGAEVVAVDIRGDGAGDVEGISRFETADVTDRSSLERVREKVADLGTPGVLVNNAGIDQPPGANGERHRVEDIPSETFGRTLEVNLAGTFHAIQVFGAPMVEAGRGSIINIGSLYAGIAPEPGFYEHLPGDPPFLKPPAYGASKAGVLNLTRYFARLWGPYGVRVNALSPGGVMGGQDPEFLRKYNARVPLRRMAAPEDLTAPLVFLASEESRYVTGHELKVDGGFTA